MIENLPTKAGIYCIKNKLTNEAYVGSTQNLRSRLRNHFKLLGEQKHHNPGLQHSWNKHGKDAFTHEVLEHCTEVGYLCEKEQDWIQKIMLTHRVFNRVTIRRPGHWIRTRLPNDVMDQLAAQSAEAGYAQDGPGLEIEKWDYMRKLLALGRQYKDVLKAN